VNLAARAACGEHERDERKNDELHRRELTRYARAAPCIVSFASAPRTKCHIELS
jgi:hypothetical protein